MHFIETISLCSGLKHQKPLIQDSFFPVPYDKYITISTDKHPSKQWDDFQEFIDLIIPFLKKENIKIVEIGRNDVKLQNITILKGPTNENQWSFIIKNSLLHIGPENFISSLASYHNIPYICLYSNTDPSYASPGWINNFSKNVDVTPDIENFSPSFLGEEKNKKINYIFSESIANKTLNLLNIKNSFNNYSVFYCGQKYYSKFIDIVPDFSPDNNFFSNAILNVRLDYKHILDFLPNFSNSRKLNIFSKQEIDLNLLRAIKPSVQSLTFEIDESSDLEYFNKLQEDNFLVTLIGSDSCSISETRFKFFEWMVHAKIKIDKKSLDNYDKICDTTRYKSSKMIFSKNGQYSSRSSYLKGIKTHQDQMIIDDKDFWEESPHYKLYNLKNI